MERQAVALEERMPTSVQAVVLLIEKDDSRWANW
jgi:hypothetical protein